MEQASSSSSSPDHAAAVGRSQLRTLLRTVRELVALKTNAGAKPTDASTDTAAATSPTHALPHDLQIAALQRQYEESREALRSTFQLLDATITSSRPAAGETEEPGPAPDEATLQRHSQLCAQLVQRNETIKELMEASRGLLNAASMWQAHKKQLDQQQHAAHRY